LLISFARASPLHDIGIIDAESPTIAIQRDSNCESHSGFGSGHDHNQKDKYLSARLTQIRGESDETEVRSIEHQLNAEKDGDYILLYDYSDSSDGEQESA
jgi:hypothetical protein